MLFCKSKYNFLAACWIFILPQLQAQDTLRINLADAENLFLEKNLRLLAAQYGINAADAFVIQAKTYPNPVFTVEANVFNPENGKMFDAGNAGQKAFQIEQVILIGGKRKSEIQMAKTNAVIARLEFQHLLRELKFKLRRGLYAIGQQQSLIKKYNNQLALLDTILSAYEIQVTKGNIPLKDLVRLKGAYLKLNNDRAELLKQHYEEQTMVQTLLQTSSVVEFNFVEKDISDYIKNKTLDELTADALKNRPDFLIAQQNNIFSEQYYKYQKRLAIPDVNLFSSYDQRGGAFNNQINTGIAIPLPFLNRNRGNIQSARFQIKEMKYKVKAAENEILSQLRNALAFYMQTVSEYQKVTSLYNNDFEITIKGMTDNFQKRNVSIIEFVDFFEAYNEVLTEITRIRIQLITSAEELNALVGKDVY